MNKPIIFVFLLFCYTSVAQELVLKDSFETPNVKQMSYDIEGNLYLLTENSFIKISAKSKERFNYSFSNEIFSFSAPTKWKIYLFGKHELLILNQQLTPIGDPFQMDGELFAVDMENRLWKYSVTRNSIAVIDLLTNQTLSEIVIGSEPDQLLIGKNKIYVVFKNEVKVYNELGSQIDKLLLSSGTLITSGVNTFILHNEQLRQLDGVLKFKLSLQPKLAAVGENELALYKGGVVFIYSIK